MRILVCGDIHCKSYFFRHALTATKWDLFVFLGDACDNFGATQEDNIEMIKLMVETKKRFGEKFVWLLGNHDWGYYDDSINMSGHIHAGAANVFHLLEESIDLWDLFYAKGKYIFSHAGITPNFLDEARAPYQDLKKRVGLNNPVNNVGYACGGTSDAPSLLWARPEELSPLPSAFDNIQIIGHTPVERITSIPGGFIICDTFSQYSNGNFIGDQSLLLIETDEEGDKLSAINYESGHKLYSVEVIK